MQCDASVAPERTYDKQLDQSDRSKTFQEESSSHQDRRFLKQELGGGINSYCWWCG